MIIDLDELYPLNEITKPYRMICIDRYTGVIDETDTIMNINPDKVISKQIELSTDNIIVMFKEIRSNDNA